MSGVKNKWLINRRTMLKGAAGVAISLPLLDVMIAPGRAAAQSVPKRFAVFFKPGGSVLTDWRPTGTESNFTLSKTLQPLSTLKQKLLVLDGIDLKITEIGSGHPHSKGMGGLLTGRELPPGPYETCGGQAGFPGGPSVDQVIANKIWTGSKFKSVQVAVNWPTDLRDGGTSSPMNTIIFSGANQPVPMSIDPKAVWDRMFKDFSKPADQVNAEYNRKKSILDSVSNSYQRLLNRVSTSDRAKLDQHLTRIREIEMSLAPFVSSAAACQQPPVPTPLGDPLTGHIGDAGSNQQKNPELDARMPDLGKAMMDLLVMAFACDLTRVGTMQFTDSQAYDTFPFLNLNNGHHGYQHDNGYQPDALTKINTWYVSQYAYFLQELDKISEQGATLLDNMAVLYTSELQQADSHGQSNMPFLLAGAAQGSFRTGRWIKYNNVSHNNLLVSLLNAYGITDKTFGNAAYCTGALANLT